MRAQKPITPPRWAERLLEWYCRPDLLEDLQGDLNEYFERNCRNGNPRKAKFIYVIDVFKFFRSYTIRRPNFINTLIHFVMIQSYITTSARSLVRNKLFSSINIIGLAISMSVGLLMISMMKDLYSYDRFHKNNDRIYRVISQYQYLGDKGNDFHATTSLKAAKAIKETFSGAEEVSILRRGLAGDFSYEDKIIPLSGLWADESMFRVFSFEMLKGNPATALKAPYSIVLTEKAAMRIFGQNDAMGKTITLNNQTQYTITGIIRDIPLFSHMKFDVLGSLSTREITEKDNPREMAWDNNRGSTYAYVLMAPDADLATFERNLDRLSELEDKTVKNTHIELALQPMNEIVTGENLSNQMGQTMGSTVIWVFSILTVIVILSACLNYTNLSIARSFRRSREIGIRKTIGALRSHVFYQFVVESVVISLLALGFAFLVFLVIRPHFLSMESSLQELLVLELSPSLVLLFILFAITVGVLAGLFPALFFARINAVQVLKNLAAIPVFKGVTLRKALIIFQYCISIIAITSTVILYKQYQHFISYDLGFKTENIINIRLSPEKADLFKKRLYELPEVKAISQSALISGIGHYWNAIVKNPKNPQDSADVYFNMIDENYLPLHEHQLVAGRNFTQKAEDAEESEVIVNEHFLKRFDISPLNPAAAIDEVIRIGEKDLRIVGVLKNFEYGKANSRASREVIMRHASKNPGCLNVKIVSGDWPQTIAKMKDIWKEIDPAHQIEPQFYDDQIQEGFKGLRASMKVGGFLAVLIITVASMGLLGMVVFTTEIRLKEISIRKVLGASETGLLLVLSRGFILLLLVSALIGLPVTYLFFDRILLPMVFNHAPISIVDLFGGFAAVMMLALLLIGSHTLKAARANPAEVLKTE